MREGLYERFATAGRALEKLSAERMDLRKERNMLQASLADKSRVETELRAQLSNLKKSAEDVQGERSTSKSTSTSGAAAAVDMLHEANAEVARLKAELASAAEEAEARASAAAVMRRNEPSGSSSSSGDRAAQMSLKGKEAELAAMREELESQARSHRAQMAELQESCHAKLREMRRVHDAQLTAVTEKVPPTQTPPPPPSTPAVVDAAEVARLREEHAAEVEALNADVARLRRQVEAAGERERASLDNAMNLADKEKKKLADAAATERRRHGNELAGLKAELEVARRRIVEAEEEAAAARRLAQSASEGRAAAAGAGGSQLDMEALDLMESQVVKLSNILQDRERELAVLQATVEGQCAERQQLIAALQSYHDAGGGGGGLQSQQSSPSMPKSQAAAALASTNLLSPRKIGRRLRPVSMSKAFK